MSTETILNSIADKYAEMARESFVCWNDACTGSSNITSPIEQILYAALNALTALEGLDAENCRNEAGAVTFKGLYITPQFEVGPYRVDFLCTYSFDADSPKKAVIIECDSHEFHDRNEPERRYEKRRDRFLQKSDFKVFRFTGKEIMSDPFRCAQEVVEFLTGCPLTTELL